MTDRLSSTYVTTGEFGVGAVLSLALSVIMARPAPFLTFSLFAALIPLIVGFLVGYGGYSSNGAVMALVVVLIPVLITFIVQGALIYAAFRQMQGARFTVSETLSHCLSRLVPLIAVAVQCALLIMVGFILLVIPGVIALLALYVAGAVCVVERRGPAESMRRSAALTKGYRWKILGAALVVGVISAVGGAIIKAVLAAASPWAGLLVEWLWQSIFYAYGAVLVAVIYYRLRAVKEGLTLDSIASVFD